MGLKQQPKCNDKSCQFCTGKHCKILNQKPEGECARRASQKIGKKTGYGQRKKEWYRKNLPIMMICVICVINRQKWKTEECVNRVMKKYARI